MDENIDNVVAKGSKTKLRKNTLGGELINVSLSFDLLLIFLFLLSLFSSREADGIPKMFSYEFLLVPAGL